MVENIEKMTAEISLDEDALYVVKDGHLTKVEAKKSGREEIVWKDGKVLDIVSTNRLRLNGQEVI